MKDKSHCLLCLLVLLLCACDNDNAAKPKNDITPPAAVQDLMVDSTAGGSITLRWTAPGDDGLEGWASRYDIRYATAALTGAGWDSATVASSPPLPKPPGQVESFAVSGLPDGTWHFGVKTADEVPNWSALSNVVTATLRDTVPPSRVIDLAATLATATTVTLTWSAPGDDGPAGTASEYDLRHALAPVTEETWADAIRVQGMPAPRTGWTRESFTVTALERAMTYYFALKAVDGAHNWSELSNIASRATASLIRLTSSLEHTGAGSPDWSPDGQRIVFNADWEPRPDYRRGQLYVIPASGGDPVKLTAIPEGARLASWSPDGTRLAFVLYRDDNPYTLQELSIMDATPGAQPTLVVSHGYQYLSKPAWSPDGSRIAYSVSTFDPPNPMVGDIYIVPSSGGSPERLIGGWGMGGQDWSPDGTRLAYSSNQSGNYDIWVIPVSGGGAVQLTNDPAIDVDPAWSPDGSQIAFMSNRAGNYDIWLMSSTGDNPAQVTTDPGFEFAPSWSPDGAGIAFSKSLNSIDDIWIVYVK